VIEFPRDYLENLFRLALELHASDLHLRVGTLPRIRVYGSMQVVHSAKLLPAEQLQAVLQAFLPAGLQQQWLKTGAVEFSTSLAEGARLRCSIFVDHDGVAASFRLLPLQPPSLEELHLPAVVTDLARAERGLILISGPRGSGLTSTLAAILAAINAERHVHIVTLESPIEFVHRPQKSLVTQIEIPTHAPSFGQALRRLALADADVCAFADLSGSEALCTALEIAESGLLVLGALNLPDVPAVVQYMLDSLLTRDYRHTEEHVVRALRAIVCQRMCRPKRSGEALIPVFEVLTTNSSAAEMIRQGKLKELHGTMMMTFNNALLRCVQEGRITPEEALLRSSDGDALRKLLSGPRKM
jgi:twitching motility protein PilT